MKDFSLKNILTVFTSIVYLFFGNNPTILYLLSGLLIFMLFDIVTGVYKSVMNKNVNSEKWTKGIKKKVGVLILISFTYFIDRYKIFNIGISIESATIGFFTMGELISILENVSNSGMKIPKILKSILEKAQAQYESGGQEDNGK